MTPRGRPRASQDPGRVTVVLERRHLDYLEGLAAEPGIGSVSGALRHILDRATGDSDALTIVDIRGSTARETGTVAFVGEANPSGGLPWAGASGNFLRELLGVTEQRVYRHEGVLIGMIGPYANGLNLFVQSPARWSVPDARRAAQALLTVLAPHRHVVLCGERVLRAFWSRDVAPLDELTPGSGVWFLPYPSGRGEWWSIKKNRIAAEALLQRLTTER